MPISDPFNIPWVVTIIQRLNPSSVLDVGTGIGAYGVLLRQYLDVCHGRISRTSWCVRIDGVEVYAPYRTPIWDYFYDRILLSDFRAAVARIDSYDVILICDVIEHFTKEEGMRILDQCLDKAKYVVVTTPTFNYPQGEWCGNQNERHLSTWTVSDFSRWQCYTKVLSATFVAVLTRDRLSIPQDAFLDIPSLVVPRTRTPGDVCEAILGQRVRLMIRHARQVITQRRVTK